MSWYPIELNLEGRRAVVVGGGQVAARKVAGLLAAGAVVRVVSPRCCPDLAERQGIEWVRQPYVADALEDADLVFACTNDRMLNARVAIDARRVGALCNNADDPGASGFLVPAVLRHGDFTVAVGTGGVGPKLAANIRGRLASLLGPEFGILVGELRKARAQVRERVPDAGLRRQIMEKLCGDDSVKLLATQGPKAWRAWTTRLVEQQPEEIERCEPADNGGDASE